MPCGAIAILLLTIVVAPGCRRKLPSATDGGPGPDVGVAAPAPPPSPSSAMPPCVDAPGSFAEVARRLAPNLVTIFASADEPEEAGPTTALPLPWAERLSQPSSPSSRRSRPLLGAGFLLAPDRRVVTSLQVLGRVTSATVRLSDGTEIEADLRGADPALDLALLQLERPVRDAVTLDGAPRPRPGDWVAVVADAFGSGPSVTVGVVRFRGPPGRTATGPAPLLSTIGIDATVDAANWGAPVVDAAGRLVGMTISSAGPGSRTGLVVPTARLLQSVSQLDRQGHPARVWLGLWVRPLDPERARTLHLDPPRGLLVSRVAADGPADRAGIQPDDVILEVSNQRISTPGELSALAATAQPGASLPVVIRRNGQSLTLQLRPAPMPR